MSAPRGGALACAHMTVRYRRRAEPTIRDVSFTVPAGGLLAVVGPSGSGKSTLCAAILGEIEQVRGRVRLDGVDLLRDRSVGRRLVSFVPQRDALHEELTPRRALALTAALRLAPQVRRTERNRRVREVLRLLEIGEHADTRIGQLSGGQRKRVAVAMELLSDPRLLMLDEPNAGLDEGLDRLMMRLLRRIADGGCTVLIITHSTANLALADHVLALDAAGQTAYYGSAEAMLEAFGVHNYAEAMQALRNRPGDPRRLMPPGKPARRTRLGEPSPSDTKRSGMNTPPNGSDPAVRHRASERRRDRRDAPSAPAPAPTTIPVTTRSPGVAHCVRVLTAREFRRAGASPLTLGRGLILLPLLGCLLTVWASDGGLAGSVTSPNRMQGAAMSVLITSITFFAMALSFSTVVGDRAVIERENRWGVPPVAVVLSKVASLIGPALLQTVMTLAVYLAVRRGPDHVIAGTPVWAGLGVCLGLLGVASMCLGLLISTASPSLERAVFLLMGSIAVLVTLNGLLIPLGHPSGFGGHTLATLSQFAPTRWGTAALAAYVGYVPIYVIDAGGRITSDAWWTQDTHHLVRALLALVVLAAAAAVSAAELLSRQSRRRR
jgi:ABC-type multidrug transport system ATPase subunit